MGLRRWWCAAVGYLCCHTVMTCSVLSRHVCHLLLCLPFWPTNFLWKGLQKAAQRRIKTSGRVAGLGLTQSPCGQLWKIIPHTHTHTHTHTDKKQTHRFSCCPLLRTEIWEAGRNAWGLGRGWFLRRSWYVDRSVRLVLIPDHVHNCFHYFREQILRCDVLTTPSDQITASSCLESGSRCFAFLY